MTWLVPHRFTIDLPSDVDYRIMLTFLELYGACVGGVVNHYHREDDHVKTDPGLCAEVQLQFVMFKLFADMGLRYPPNVDASLRDVDAGLVSWNARVPDSIAPDVMVWPRSCHSRLSDSTDPVLQVPSACVQAMMMMTARLERTVRVLSLDWPMRFGVRGSAVASTRVLQRGKAILRQTMAVWRPTCLGTSLMRSSRQCLGKALARWALMRVLLLKLWLRCVPSATVATCSAGLCFT